MLNSVQLDMMDKSQFLLLDLLYFSITPMKVHTKYRFLFMKSDRLYFIMIRTKRNFTLWAMIYYTLSVYAQNIDQTPKPTIKIFIKLPRKTPRGILSNFISNPSSLPVCHNCICFIIAYPLSFPIVHHCLSFIIAYPSSFPVLHTQNV